MIFFTGDTHFGDPRVLHIDRRPFSDIAAHDAALIENWNAVVGNEDDVWHLGDFMSPKAGDCAGLGKLRGRKHLVVGNNDPAATTGSEGWVSIQHYAEIK